MAGPDDDRFDRSRDRLVAFVATLANSAVGVCWDLANEWLSAVRSGGDLALPKSVPSCVQHVHLHGSTGDGLLHAPLGGGNVPWQAAMELLVRDGWCGSATLEIRYRLAHDLGDPWTVLADSIRQALSVRN
jgi:sugar phosphate isomerase/epimerase